MNWNRWGSAFAGAAGVLVVAVPGWVTPSWWHVAAFFALGMFCDYKDSKRTGDSQQ